MYIAAAAAEAVPSEEKLNLPLYKAALAGDWEAAQKVFQEDRNAFTASISLHSDTALHIALGSGKIVGPLIQKLVSLMPAEALAYKNDTQKTPLAIAAITGNTKAAELLVEKNRDLLYISGEDDALPLILAAQYSQKETIDYLLDKTSYPGQYLPSPFSGILGYRFLHHLIASGYFDIALKFAKEYRHLLTMTCDDVPPLLSTLASMPFAFKSGRSVNFWRQLIYKCLPDKKINKTSNMNRRDIENPVDCGQMRQQTRNTISVPIRENPAECGQMRQRENPGNCGQMRQQIISVLHKILGSVPLIKDIQDLKFRHHEALEFLKYLCSEIQNSERPLAFRNAMFVSAIRGTCEVAEEMLAAVPPILWCFDGEGHSVLHVAVLNRSEKVYNLIYQMSESKHNILHTTDYYGNTILHLAGRLAPSEKLNSVAGAALQMQREIQWFEKVKGFLQRFHIEMENVSGDTARVVFTREHKSLVKEGEKWMKDTATSCTIVAALVTTVAFAAAISMPGGNNGNTGFPVFSGKNVFLTFAISNAISLVMSTTSLLMFLGILTARFEEKDFHYALPNKLIFGLATLFFSITAMVVAFGATLYLVLGEKNQWFRIVMFSTIALPILSFMVVQFPLLVDVISSTHGPGIFRKQHARLLH